MVQLKFVDSSGSKCMQMYSGVEWSKLLLHEGFCVFGEVLDMYHELLKKPTFSAIPLSNYSWI